MSFGQFLVLWLLFIGYLFLGAFIFYATERRHEEAKRVEDNIEKLELEDILRRYYPPINAKVHRYLVQRLRQRCNATDMPIDVRKLEPVIEEVEEEFQWTLYNSFFFALTTLSTIGYGNLHPTSSLGRILVIFYSLVGIPLNGIVLTQLGEFFASTFLRVHQRYKGKRFETRFVLIVDIVTYLIPGVLIFIFLPSGLFVYFEGWSFDESVYFAFVTLTTIGYGDYVAGQTTKDKPWYAVYKVALLLWIMFGLGYLVMILGFISRAMRCKRMARFEQKLAQNIKQTQNKLWSGFAKDVMYVRRMLNEMYLLKFKPVYQDRSYLYGSQSQNRSRSLPDLRNWHFDKPILEPLLPTYGSKRSEDELIDEEEIQIQFEKYRMNRRKGLSQNFLKKDDLRVRSEGDLYKIDRVATFGTAACVEPGELLARVVDVLGTTYGLESTSSSDMSSDDEEDDRRVKKLSSRYEKELSGIDCFTSEEILSSEWYPQPPQTLPPIKKYSADVIKRSSSIPSEEKEHAYSEQWTWPGDSSLRSRESSKIKDATTTGRRYLLPDDVPVSKRPSIPGVSKLRRMSAAALNFLMYNKKPPSAASTGIGSTAAASGGGGGGIAVIDNDIESTNNNSSDRRKRKTGGLLVPPTSFKNGNNSDERKQRYSLCDLDQETIMDDYYRNYYSQTTNKTSNNIKSFLQDHLQQHLNPKENVSPILRQTTLEDFMRVLSSLRDVTASSAVTAEESLLINSNNNTTALFEGQQKKSSLMSRRSPLFSLFQQDQYQSKRRHRSVSCTLAATAASDGVDQNLTSVITSDAAAQVAEQRRPYGGSNYNCSRRYSLFSQPRNDDSYQRSDSSLPKKTTRRSYSQSQFQSYHHRGAGHHRHNRMYSIPQIKKCLQTEFGVNSDQVINNEAMTATTVPDITVTPCTVQPPPVSRRIRRFSVRPASLSASRKNSCSSTNN